MQRILNFIKYLLGERASPPDMADELTHTMSSVMRNKFAQDIMEVLKESQFLSESIFNAETEVQRLAMLIDQMNKVRL